MAIVVGFAIALYGSAAAQRELSLYSLTREVDNLRVELADARGRIADLQKRVYDLEEQGSRPLDTLRAEHAALTRRVDEIYNLGRAVAVPALVYVIQLFMGAFMWVQRQTISKTRDSLNDS